MARIKLISIPTAYPGTLDKVSTHQRSHDSYGVVIDGNAVNRSATQTLRTELAAKAAVAEFAFGLERDAYNQIWTPKVRSFLAQAVLAMPKPVRQHTIELVREKLTLGGELVTEADVVHAIDEANDFLEGRSYRAAAE